MGAELAMLDVLLLQLPVPNNPGANVALAAGYLKAYAASQGLLEHVNIEILPRDLADRGGDALLVAAICARRPAVLGLSLYTWNSERSLTIAAMVRERLPEIVIVAGGPEVQADNDWVLDHPALDLAIIGEGEQAFAALLRQLLAAQPTPACRWCRPSADLLAPATTAAIPGSVHRHGSERISAPPLPSLEPLDRIPSPYLAGYLELRPGEMALIECSRWCPYGCTFCLYGRNMGAKLGGRMFSIERILAEVRWAREQQAGAIHFVEANLNLVPGFRELMAELKALNQPEPTPLYAELRGEHLKPEAVAALAEAGLVTAEVGLQSANTAALALVGRRTDLDKWAAGTRRLYDANVNVLLDVILGLPGDDRATTLATIDWIAQQGLGPYDIFTLQVLPGTGVRTEAARFGISYQDRPPYYVLATEAMSYGELRGLRWELREAAGLDPSSVEGLPLPPPHAWQGPVAADAPLSILVCDTQPRDWAAHGHNLAATVASHVTVRLEADLAALEALCWPIASANPTIHWDILVLDQTPPPQELRALGARWPHAIGYLDRVAVYRRPQPEPAWWPITPRWWIVLDWHANCDPLAYEGIAAVVWRIPAADAPKALEPLARRGGQGVIISGPIDSALSEAYHEAGLPVLAAS